MFLLLGKCICYFNFTVTKDLGPLFFKVKRFILSHGLGWFDILGSGEGDTSSWDKQWARAHTNTQRHKHTETETEKDTQKYGRHRFLRYFVPNMNINSNINSMNTCGIANVKISNIQLLNIQCVNLNIDFTLIDSNIFSVLYII